MKPMQAFSKRQNNGLSLKSEILMDIVYSQREIQVMNLIQIAIDSGVASHATLHKALMDAVKLGFVDITTSLYDGRNKTCSLTTKGKAYFNRY